MFNSTIDDHAMAGPLLEISHNRLWLEPRGFAKIVIHSFARIRAQQMVSWIPLASIMCNVRFLVIGLS